MIKLFATDLDGTLLNDEKGINEQDYRAINSWVEKGNLFVVATGRGHNCVDILNKYALYPDYVIGLTGATLHDKYGNLLNQHCYELDLLKKVCDFLMLGNLCDFKIDVEHNQCWYGYLGNRFFQSHFGKEIENYVEYRTFDLTSIRALKIVARFGNEMICADFKQMLNDKFKNIAVYEADYCLIEIVPIEINKFAGILDVLNRVNLAVDNVACIGDQGNDSQMVENAHIGFAMRGSNLSTMGVADKIVGSVSEALEIINLYNLNNSD